MHWGGGGRGVVEGSGEELAKLIVFQCVLLCG